MYTLSNDALSVEILDPLADQARFGTRYCTGGYIFQITDARHGPLLSGPTYPHAFNWFDGQGIPDAFNLGPLREAAAADARALIIGTGVCDLASNQVLEFCRWEVEQQAAAIAMRTTQTLGDFALDLERTVALAGRTLRTTTRLRNTGRRPIPVHWFPHPFFPQLESDELCWLNIPFGMPDNPGYEIGPSGFISRKSWPWTDGYYQALDHAAQAPVVVLQRHPQLGLVAAACSYVPSLFPIWGNRYTFSWEPFLERTVMPGQILEWWIDYSF